jgi:hypothetical protein
MFDSTLDSIYQHIDGFNDERHENDEVDFSTYLEFSTEAFQIYLDASSEIFGKYLEVSGAAFQAYLNSTGAAFQAYLEA